MRFLHPDLPQWFSQGATVLTPSPLLASVLQRQFGKLQVEAGRAAWPQPPLLSLSAWLQQAWRDARYRLGERVPVLLSPSQELMAWQDAILESGADVLDLAGAARSARAAARLMAEWHVPAEAAAWQEHQDARVFLEWRRGFEQRCRDEGWLPAAHLLAAAADWIPSSPEGTPHSVGAGHPTPARHVVFAGFADPSPALRRMAAKLAGTRVEFAQASGTAVTLEAQQCASWGAEIDAAARWARATLEAHPEASIAIVVPGLNDHRGMVDRTVRNVLRPASVMQSVLGTPPPAQMAYQLHADAALREVPVVAAARLLFDLAGSSVPLASASAILRSPYVAGAATEFGLRAAADVQLRKPRQLEVTHAAIEKAIARCPVLLRLWAALRTIVNSRPPERAECAAWARFTSRLLEAVGWPGDRALTPMEEQAVEQWKDALSSLGSLGLIGHSVTWTEARELLRQPTAAASPREGGIESPIQVLDPGDAASLRFDYAWVCGLSDQSWPPASSPAPFLPLALQRGAQLPAATAEGRREQAQRLSREMRQLAPFVLGSFSAETGTEARLSRLFPDAAMRQAGETPRWTKPLPLEQIVPVACETLDDSSGPPIFNETAFDGGTQILKSQSDCPFQAFAKWRLGAAAPEEGTFAFDSRERGSFLHKALEHFWRTVVSSANLQVLADTELAEIVRRSVAAALAKDRDAAEFRVHLREAEGQRLELSLTRWVEIEKHRAVGFTVRQVERNSEFVSGVLRFGLRVDRVDEVDGGGLVLIDYKSGSPKLQQLDDERPEEPQLLVYAAAVEGDIEGLYFAKLKPRDEAPVGYARRSHFRASSEKVIGNWTQWLSKATGGVHELAAEFVAGYAVVDPRNATTCKYCDVKPLCRIAERSSAAPDEDGEE